MKNQYMEEVIAQQAVVQQKMRKRAAPRQAAQRMASPPELARSASGANADSRDESPGGPAVDVRITGWWLWKKVIVPPNAYVVHTRAGKEQPLHVGLGTSFDYNDNTDSFLVVPSAMQTIMISANTICSERQGILVQGYVQWIIQDIATAYRKLDFSDPYDPMGVVNLQLGEQAEAAIKDTVATMSINDVLADKQPIVEELTTRLRQLAEGDKAGDGLGLRIITVQIKEAVVSSSRVWGDLQRAFRAERSKEARLAELTHEAEVSRREAEAERERTARELAAQEEIAELRAQSEAAAFDRSEQERARRAKVEAETLEATRAHERRKAEAEAEAEREQLDRSLALDALRQDASQRRIKLEIELDAARRTVENDVSPARLQAQLIEALPGIAEQMPRPQELKAISIGGAEGLAPVVQQLVQLTQAIRTASEPKAAPPG